MSNHIKNVERKRLSLTGRITSKSADSGLPLDDLLEILNNERRRFALAAIAERYGEIDSTDLVETVAELETGCAREEVSRDVLLSIKNSFRQTHLPKLKKKDIITQDRDTIRAGKNAPQVFRHLDSLLTMNDAPKSVIA